MGQSARWRYRSLYLDPQAITSLCSALGMSKPVYFSRNTLGDAGLISANSCALHAALDGEDGDVQGHYDMLSWSSFGTLLKRYSSVAEANVFPTRHARNRCRLTVSSLTCATTTRKS